MTNIIRKIDRDTLYNVWGLPHDADEDMGVKVLDDITGDSGRWESHHTVVFVAPDDGLTYSANYDQGLTENQDQRPWEYDDEITLTQVESRQRVITVTDWVPVKEPEEVKVPTLTQLKAQWARNKDWDEASWSEACEW